MKKIAIITTHNVNNSYSCLLYLKRTLANKYNVRIYAPTRSSLLSSIDQKDYVRIRKSKIAQVKGFGGIVNRLYFLKAFFGSNAIVINDLDFFVFSYYLKKIFPRKRVIHYNTEIHGLDVPYRQSTIRFYNKHASFPDLIIECLNERSNFRKKNFNINKEIFVINNTIPLEEINSALSIHRDVDSFFKFKIVRPIAIYAGGCDMSRSLKDVIECSDIFKNELNFMFFCHGPNDQYAIIENMVRNRDNCLLYQAVDRITLLHVMEKCDIGIQYYDPEYSENHLYAAPSKFFEYIGVGLNVVSSNNEGINKIINKYNLGVCFENNENMSDAFRRLLNKGLTPRQEIMQVFSEKYCYEIDSAVAVRKIEEIIG